jgi:hypothetical protein
MTDAIYFISPTAESIQLVIDDFLPEDERYDYD